MSYRDLPDPGLIIGRGLSALARGFAAIAEGAILERKLAQVQANFSDASRLREAIDRGIHYMLRRLPGCSVGTTRVPLDPSTIVWVRWCGQHHEVAISDRLIAAASDPQAELLAVLDRLIDRFLPTP